MLTLLDSMLVQDPIQEFLCHDVVMDPFFGAIVYLYGLFCQINPIPAKQKKEFVKSSNRKLQKPIGGTTMVVPTKMVGVPYLKVITPRFSI